MTITDHDDEDTRTVAELIEDLPEPIQYYPVILEVTERRVAWVEAESQQDAYDSLEDDAYDYWKDAEADDFSAGLGRINPADRWNHYDYETAREIHDMGPAEGCQECGGSSNYVRWNGIDHTPSCSQHQHRVDSTLLYRRTEEGREQLVEGVRLPRCSCGEPGWTAPFLSANVGDEGLPEPVSRDDLPRLAQEHVAGRPHSKNVPLGITDCVVRGRDGHLQEIR